jgi:hypothetical protein
MLVDAGFADVRVVEKAESREFIKDWLPGSGAEDFVVSANVTATKPSFGREFIKEPKKEPESLAASAAAAFGDASGASASAAARVGAAAAAFVVALGGAVRSVGEHHARHTDEACVSDTEDTEEAPEPVCSTKDTKAGC